MNLLDEPVRQPPALSDAHAGATEITTAPYILLVEDNPGDAHLTQDLLDQGGDATLPSLRWVQSMEAAVQVLESEPGCHAVLLDLGLPDSLGLSTLQAIRPYTRDCPVVVLTGEASEAVGLAAVVDGAQDYLVKGSLNAGLLRRSIVFSAHRKRAERALLERALHDELTGLPQRALFMDRLHEALKRSARNHTEGAVLFIDLDHFKQINDVYGHAAGDAVLCAVGRRLLQTLRDIDTVARLGGDEFVVLLPTVAVFDDALVVSHKVLQALSQPLSYLGHQLELGASLGLANFRGGDETAAQLMNRADTAMYAAKAAGRGAVRSA